MIRCAGALLALALLGGCSGSSHTVVVNRLTTRQQELADLQRAAQMGLLSPSEYATQRAKVAGRE